MATHTTDPTRLPVDDSERHEQLQFELRLSRSRSTLAWRAELLAPPAPGLVFESLADLIGYLARLDGQAPRRGIR